MNFGIRTQGVIFELRRNDLECQSALRRNPTKILDPRVEDGFLEK